VIINELKFYGRYGVVINSSGVSYLPTVSSSKPDYFTISLPAGSNLSINIEEGGGSGVFMIGNSSQPFHVIKGGKVEFQGIEPIEQPYSVSVLMKRPQINVNGSANFKNIISNDILVPSGEKGEVNGTLALRLGYLDQYDENTRKGGKIQYLTYLDNLRIKKEMGSTGDRLGIRLPGDVSESLEIQVSWIKVIFSNSSLIALFMIIIIMMTICVSYFSLFRSKIMKLRGLFRA
jgi:hypothetical protein